MQTLETGRKTVLGRMCSLAPFSFIIYARSLHSLASSRGADPLWARELGSGPINISCK